jgi:cytoskeletal protein CcmA (bactofilin family)
MFVAKSKKPETTQLAPMPVAVKTERTADVEPITSLRTESPNVIGKGTIIQGNIVAEGDLIIEGTVRGDVTTKTTLVVGPNCVIEGNIVAEHAEVAGQVKGTVQALGLLVIKSSSMIDGDVLTKNLNVESGSTFNGRFTVGSVTSTVSKKADAAKPEASVLGSDVRRPAAAVTTMPSKV